MPIIELPSPLSLYEPPANLAARQFVALWAVMAYPHDAAARQRLNDVQKAASISDAIRRAREPLVRTDLALWLAAAPDPSAVRASVETSAFAGTIAGLMLGWIVFRGRQRATMATASLGAAIRATDKACRRAGLRGASIDTIRLRLWPAYRPVAHLWTAYQYWRDGGHDDSALATPEDVRQLLAIGEAFRLAGETFRPLRADATVLDPAETWRVDSALSATWPPVDLECDAVADWDPRLRIG